jgi:hypothetical protein
MARRFASPPGLIAAALLAASAGAGAASSNRGLLVTVDLLNIPDKTVECKRAVMTGADGAKVDVVCGLVPPTLSTPSRFMLQVYRSQERLGTVDSEMDAGTVTSWRVVRLQSREYLEMTVGW